jgi:uncharacterized protein (DUF433 family)
MSKEYVEQRDGGYWITGKRISLASVVYAFKDGAAPESILRSFPLLSLEEIYGAIAFYLSNQKDIDAYLSAREAEFERQREQERKADPSFYKKFDEARAVLK